MKILIINGPNLNLLGKRQTEIYGELSFDDYIKSLNKNNIQISVFQSNIEGEIINCLHENNADGIIINAGGYTHTSVAIRDAISSIETPVVEVHISNIASRESFRHESLISPVAVGCIFGFGMKGYELALDYFEKSKH
ncbi:type II 3-dehydroquinate dehydratase [Brumimicrobium aurantiacum]|uniref:3-dehydroquinate dehydratase n=1 Tax=Brumimicrobium aurantiacum TaxID=1737063 RepID=A0A3E1F107_9FLAO|nr:type II 3-dehydroquinate dehydratase [Brumimicrobium aurantiacum]RFC55511.1 type II 3-dehydroquinate dehydratase [Brumimicrobium aurantiacum]